MFKCEICGFEAKSKAGLRTHQTQKHEGNAPEPIECQVCHRSIGAHAFGLHIKRLHHINAKEYYDLYKKKPGEGICINCGKPTHFISMYTGYSIACSSDCQRRNVWNNMTDEQKSQSIKKNSESVKNHIKNRSTEQSSKIMKKLHHSQVEQDIRNAISSVYTKQVIGPIKSKKYIYPYELDIVLPDANLAIEYNGLYWHSSLRKPNDYHLMKSLLCREKGIRLIHIYEFEDLDKQLELLKALLLGKDKYPKNDFNKNNLIKNIPTPKIIYQNGRYTIYGAGELIRDTL